MVQRGRRLRLAPEPGLEGGVAGEVGAEPLDRHGAAQADVGALADLGHAAAAEQLAELVASADAVRFGHRAQPPCPPLPLPLPVAVAPCPACRAVGAVARSGSAGGGAVDLQGDRRALVDLAGRAHVGDGALGLVAGVVDRLLGRLQPDARAAAARLGRPAGRRRRPGRPSTCGVADSVGLATGSGWAWRTPSARRRAGRRVEVGGCVAGGGRRWCRGASPSGREQQRAAAAATTASAASGAERPLVEPASSARHAVRRRPASAAATGAGGAGHHPASQRSGPTGGRGAGRACLARAAPRRSRRRRRTARPGPWPAPCARWPRGRRARRPAARAGPRGGGRGRWRPGSRRSNGRCPARHSKSTTPRA